MATSTAHAAEAPTQERAAAIAVEGITHRYGERTALSGVSFTVNHSEVLGLLGPNGSGKTSLFRILSTLMLPSEGDARIMGASVRTEPYRVRRQIGVVFQEKSVDVKLTAAENLRHQGHLYGMRGVALQERVREMLERVGLSERAHEWVEKFSGGMQRRVELAKGLMHKPAVLLLDEPTTGLDPGARIDLWKYLTALRDAQGTSVLITTHLMEEAERCDRLAILHEGRLVALGTPAELKAEIGGDVVELEVRDAEAFSVPLEKGFGVKAVRVGNRLRFETELGHRFGAQLAEKYPDEIVSVTVSKPSLEDVFIRKTGHRFWSEGDGKSG
ncbi:MAG: ABC transporter ATP-binding protein [Acidobacteriales bacterium]|nr:ABC transporter ATP-binding protein [Terriglobales bacterium]